MGLLQITVMFLFGMVAFGLPFFRHLPGFAVMATMSAAAVAAFGLVLATAARTRQQLSGISTIVILAMSAIGGSMFPRFLMPPTMRAIGRITPNAWALDGFIKVFWRDAALPALLPEVAMLVGFTALFLFAARVLARRWETA
jgi:ABC-2 type transport system permease protein